MNSARLINHFLKVLLVAFALVFASSCSRDDGDSKDKSKISIALPQTLPAMHQKMGAFAVGDTLIYAAVSISGPGVETISYIWESCRDCSSAPPPPGSFDFEVPGGTGRLFQLLAAYESASTGSVSLYYGETVKDLLGGEVDVPINISQIQQGPFVQGRIAGRYLDGPDSGPTGLVDVFYYPPSGRPKMKFETTSMTAGWFNFFLIAGANFEFVLRSTGEVIWGQPVNLESSFFAPVANGSVMRAYYPVHVRKQNVPAPTYFEYYLESAKILTWGFWNKPGSSGNASSKFVCRNVGVSTLDKNRLYNASSPSSTAGLTVAYSYSGTPSMGLLADTVSPHGSVYILGGQAYNAGGTSCAGNDISLKFDKFLMAENSNVDGSGNDNFVGFQRIFQTDPNGGTLKESSNSTTTSRNIEYKLLPGVGNIVTHMRVFTKAGFSNNDRIENPQCALLASQGWTPNTVSSTSTNYATLLSSVANIAGSGIAAVVCPMTSTTSFLGWGAGFMSPQYFKIPSTISTTWSGTPGVNQCLTILADLKDANGSFLNVGANTNFAFTAAGVTGNFYSDASCTIGASASMSYTLLSGNATLTGYFKPGTSGTLTVNITGSPMGIPVTGVLNQPITP